MSAQSNWIAVASAEHVRIGHAQGFMQVNHGKAAPLRRLRPGSLIIYYSPSERFGVKDSLQSFTAIGRVKAGEPYQGDMGCGFHPFRRDVAWLPSHPAPIRPLLDKLDFTHGAAGWGQRFRFGLFSIDDRDARTIATAMGASSEITAADAG